MSELRSRRMFFRRRDVPAPHRRWARPAGATCAPELDEPHELAPEEISVETGELVHPSPAPAPAPRPRRQAQRRPPTH